MGIRNLLVRSSQSFCIRRCIYSFKIWRNWFHKPRWMNYLNVNFKFVANHWLYHQLFLKSLQLMFMAGCCQELFEQNFDTKYSQFGVNVYMVKIFDVKWLKYISCQIIWHKLIVYASLYNGWLASHIGHFCHLHHNLIVPTCQMPWNILYLNWG